MSVLGLIISVGIAVYALFQYSRYKVSPDSKTKKALLQKPLLFVTGCFAIVALVGVTLGISEHAGVVIVGLAGCAVTVCKTVLDAASFMFYLKKHPDEYTEYFEDMGGLYHFKHTALGAGVYQVLLGLGWVFRLLMCLTIIGIPIMKLVDRQLPELDELSYQSQLRAEYDTIQDLTKMNTLLRELNAQAKGGN